MANTERDDQLLNAIDAQEETAYGSDSDGTLATERAYAIDQYLGRNTLPAPDGRSQVVDRSVYETVQGMMPSLSRIFANGEDVVELPPVGREDEQGAKQEAQFLNYQILQKNNWFQIFDTAAKDALLTKAGYLHPYAKKRRQVEPETYMKQTQEGVAYIMQDKPEIISVKEYPDPEFDPAKAQPEPVIDPATGQPAIGPDGQPMLQPPQAPMLYDLEIRRTKEETHYCIEVLPPERCKVAETTKTVQLEECDYFEYYDFVTISALRQDGYKVDDDISEGEGVDDTEEDLARNQFNETIDDNKNDPSMRRVKCRWIWIRYDYDEDGIAELQYCVVVGKTLLHREEVNRIPVAVFCPDTLPHRHVGLCPADTVADIQQINTVILRGGLDNLQLSNNSRSFIDPSMVNLDDALISRPGGVVRGKPGAIYGQHYAPIVTPFIFPQAIEGLGYMDQVKEKRTGVSNYFTGLDQNALNKTATGIQQLSTMAAQRVEQIARHIANGVEALASILHEVILKNGHKKETVQLRGEWVDIDPAQWKKRTDFRISVGFAAGNKDAMVARLMMIAQMQEKAIAGGLPIANAENAYETAIELTKASDLQAPERFWMHPSKAPQPQPPQPDVTVMAMETLKAQSSEAIKQAELKASGMETAAKLEIDKYKADLQSQTSLQIEQMKQQHAAEVEKFRAHSQVEGQTQLKKLDARLNGKEDPEKVSGLEKQLGDLQNQLQQSLEAVNGAFGKIINAKRVISRGKDGKAARVDTVDDEGNLLASQSVQRGADGRVVGAG